MCLKPLESYKCTLDMGQVQGCSKCSLCMKETSETLQHFACRLCSYEKINIIFGTLQCHSITIISLVTCSLFLTSSLPKSPEIRSQTVKKHSLFLLCSHSFCTFCDHIQCTRKKSHVLQMNL